jgi:hypothetical protein
VGRGPRLPNRLLDVPVVRLRQRLLNRIGAHDVAFVEQGQEEVVLAAGEVVVERAAGQARVLGDLVERRSGEPSAAEHVARALEQPLARLPTPFGLRQSRSHR